MFAPSLAFRSSVIDEITAAVRKQIPIQLNLDSDETATSDYKLDGIKLVAASIHTAILSVL